MDVNMAEFKDKDRRCPRCKHKYKGHEEKETDVHLALCCTTTPIVTYTYTTEHSLSLGTPIWCLP